MTCRNCKIWRKKCEFPTGTSRCAYATCSHSPLADAVVISESVASPQSVKKRQLSPDEGLEATGKTELATSLARMQMQLRVMKYQYEGVRKAWKAQYGVEWSGHKDYDAL